MATILEEISQAVIEGEATVVKELTEKALGQGVAPLSMFREALIPGMDEVGRRMQAEEYYIPEVLLSARAMKTASDRLKPLMIQSGGLQPLGRVVFGTVRGDLHDIGKNLVAMMLEGAGFEVTDLGVNVPPDQFVEKIKGANANILAMSAMLTTTMLEMREVIQSLQDAGVRQEVMVMVGGAPLNQRFADEIGADGYAPEAASATELAKKLVAAQARS